MLQTDGSFFGSVDTYIPDATEHPEERDALFLLRLQ